MSFPPSWSNVRKVCNIAEVASFLGMCSMTDHNNVWDKKSKQIETVNNMPMYVLN